MDICCDIRFRIKSRIRKAAEEEERKFYEERIPDDWAEVLRPLGTDHVKEHLTDAPWVVVLFRHSKRLKKNGDFAPTYYSQESCGIARVCSFQRFTTWASLLSPILHLRWAFYVSCSIGLNMNIP